MKLRTLPYNKVCGGCAKLLHKGEQAWFGKHEGARCVDCGNSSPPAGPAPDSPRKPDSPRTPRRPVHEPGPVYAPPADPKALCPPVEPGADGVHRFGWDSVADLVADAFSDRAQCQATRVFLRDTIHRQNEREWANHHTIASLREAVAKPSPKLLAAIDEMRGHLLDDLAIPSAPRRRVRRGLDAGDEMDPDRWLTRTPNCWEQSQREPQPRRTVTIGINVTVYWAQKPEELLHRGAAACALADVLTARGVNVRILGFSVGTDCSDRVKKLVTTVELKRSDMPLDMAALATATCDVGFFRMAVMPAEFRHLPGKACEGLGTRLNQKLPEADRRGIDYLVESHVTTRKAAVEWLRGIVAATSQPETEA